MFTALVGIDRTIKRNVRRVVTANNAPGLHGSQDGLGRSPMTVVHLLLRQTRFFEPRNGLRGQKWRRDLCDVLPSCLYPVLYGYTVLAGCTAVKPKEADARRYLDGSSP
jgi:hypothetical protein